MKGRETTTYLHMDQRRKSKLRYVRMPVHGLEIGPGLDDLFALAWRPGELLHWAAFGIFHKLLEIAANRKREERGWLLDADGMPLTAAYFAKRFHEIESTKLIEEVFGFLVRVGWLEIVEIEKTPGNFREIPENTGGLINNTDTETETETNSNRKKAAAQRQALFAMEARRVGSTTDR